MADAFAAVKPPTFSGKPEEDADAFIKAFDRFVRYKELVDGNKQLNLLAVLFQDTAADWFESLADNQKDTIAKLRAAFASRYQTPEALKIKSATEIFTRKQATNESVDDYVLHMQKLGKLIAADDNIIRFAIINGFKPYISVQVTQARPTSIDEILNVARIAELTMPRVMAREATEVSKQLAELTEDVRRLTTQFNKATTTKIQSRSSTPERSDRRVHFPTSSSPPVNESHASSETSDRLAQSAYYSGHNHRAPLNFRPSSLPNRRGRFESQMRPTSVVETGPCTRCARMHSKRGYCPAMDPTKRCNFCGKQFHFQAACFAAARQHQY
jgi:Retrotransposon gag protein